MLKVNRSTIYYEKKQLKQEDIVLIGEIRNVYEKHSFFGYRKIHAFLKEKGLNYNIKKIQRLMQSVGIRAVYPEKKTTMINKKHKKYPYLLKELKIEYSNHVWQIDITYIKTRAGYTYLVCLIDIFSRKIMGWNLSPFLDTHSCIDAYNKASKTVKPSIINSDQGCQFTSTTWIERLSSDNILISMDGKGRWADNIYIERLWRTIKYEMVYLQSFGTITQLRDALKQYILFYNTIRPHQALHYKTPQSVYEQFVDTKQGRKIMDQGLDCFFHKKSTATYSQVSANFLS